MPPGQSQYEYESSYFGTLLIRSWVSSLRALAWRGTASSACVALDEMLRAVHLLSASSCVSTGLHASLGAPVRTPISRVLSTRMILSDSIDRGNILQTYGTSACSAKCSLTSGAALRALLGPEPASQLAVLTHLHTPPAPYSTGTYEYIRRPIKPTELKQIRTWAISSWSKLCTVDSVCKCRTRQTI